MKDLDPSIIESIISRKIDGESDQTLVEKMCNLGLDRQLAERILSQTISECLRAEAKLRRWKRRIESILEAHRQLRQLNSAANEIKRINKPDYKYFLDNFYSVGVPVVVSGLFDHWPALRKWSPQYIIDKLGDIDVEVMGHRNSDKNYELNRDEHKIRVRLSDFNKIVLGDATNDFYMVAHNFSMSGPLAELSEDILAVPGVLRPPDNLSAINFWFGPSGTVTPLHHDSTNVLLGQIWGEKRVIVYPWQEIHLLYNEVAAFSRFDPERPDYTEFPLAEHATRMEVTLKPGDALFIPIGTWHQVRSLSPSISLSMSHFVYKNRFLIHNP